MLFLVLYEKPRFFWKNLGFSYIPLISKVFSFQPGNDMGYDEMSFWIQNANHQNQHSNDYIYIPMGFSSFIMRWCYTHVPPGLRLMLPGNSHMPCKMRLRPFTTQTKFKGSIVIPKIFYQDHRATNEWLLSRWGFRRISIWYVGPGKPTVHFGETFSHKPI